MSSWEDVSGCFRKKLDPLKKKWPKFAFVKHVTASNL